MTIVVVDPWGVDVLTNEGRFAALETAQEREGCGWREEVVVPGPTERAH